MKRGDRGYNFQAPLRQRDEPTQSSIAVEHGEAGGVQRLVVLAAFSLAIAIVSWHLRHHGPPHVNLWSRKPGILFPLYGYSYKQFLNASDVLEEKLWHKRRALHSRSLQQVDPPSPLFIIKNGFYVTMKLGVPPREFKFLMDSGSQNMWVHCNAHGHQTYIKKLGPNGIFRSIRGSILKCIGESYDTCKELQQNYKHLVKCDASNQYECVFYINYVDTTIVSGVFVKNSITLQMEDKTEVTIPSIFGCTTYKTNVRFDPPFLADGIFGMGNCKWTLPNQWFRTRLISQNVVGFCIAKTTELSKFTQIGFVSFGIDFKGKFKKNDCAWAPLVKPPLGVFCAYATNLLFISFQGDIIKTKNHGIATIIDTGSTNTYLEKELYDPLIYLMMLWNIPNSNFSQKLRKQLNFYATSRGYEDAEDDIHRILSEKRQCWRPPSKSRKNDKGKKISPINDFPNLKFAIEGTFDAKDSDLILYLIAEPRNYLHWDETEKTLCVDILKDDDILPAQTFGAMILKEHLFVFDVHNQRVRWQPDTCELP